MRIPVFLSVIRRRKLAIGLLVVGISMVATGVLRGRIAEEKNRVPKLDHKAAQFDPSTLKTDIAGGGARALAKGGLIIVPGAAPMSDKMGTRSTQPSMSLPGRVDELPGGSSVDDVTGDKDGLNEDVAKLFSREAGSGLGGFASPIARGHSGVGGGAPAGGMSPGGGSPGGYSSGLRSDFNHPEKGIDRTEEVRAAAASRDGEAVSAAARTLAVVTTYDPNRPFGNNDLTQQAIANDLKKLEPNAEAAAAIAPVAMPEPGTLLLVTNGIVAAVGSRYLRRRRRH